MARKLTDGYTSHGHHKKHRYGKRGHLSTVYTAYCSNRPAVAKMFKQARDRARVLKTWLGRPRCARLSRASSPCRRSWRGIHRTRNTRCAPAGRSLPTKTPISIDTARHADSAVRSREAGSVQPEAVDQQRTSIHTTTRPFTPLAGRYTAMKPDGRCEERRFRAPGRNARAVAM